MTSLIGPKLGPPYSEGDVVDFDYLHLNRAKKIDGRQPPSVDGDFLYEVPGKRRPMLVYKYLGDGYYQVYQLTTHKRDGFLPLSKLVDEKMTYVRTQPEIYPRSLEKALVKSLDELAWRTIVQILDRFKSPRRLPE